PAQTFCHSLSRHFDRRLWSLTCRKVGLTRVGAADTFRNAPSGPSDREERPDEALGAPTEGGNVHRRIQAHREHLQGGEAARSLSRREFSTQAKAARLSQRPAGTSRDGPAVVRRPGPTESREARGRSTGTAERPQGRTADPGRRRRKGAARRTIRRRSGLSAQRRGSSGQLSPRNRREPNASAGGERRSLGLFFMRYRLTPMTEGRVKRSAEADERRSRIIEAAMSKFSEHGYRG